MNPVTESLANVSILHDADAVSDFPPQYFDPEHWRENGGYEGEAEEGKGSTVFVRHEGQSWAMRHYCRGGGMALLFRDIYLWLGLQRTRPWREWYLLAKLHEQGLPVPAPIAARVVRSRFVYRADLVMQKIENARIWQDYMREDALRATDWQALGRFLRRFHDAGLYHHDLNIRNIMRTGDGELYLIDFDQARLRSSGSAWKRQNLERLHRSIDKLQRQGIDLHFSEPSWRQMLQGYMLAAS